MIIDLRTYLSSVGAKSHKDWLQPGAVARLDLSATQDFYIKIGGRKNNFQFRADILNFTNMINKDWGITQRATNPNVLAYNSTAAGNIPVYQLATQTDTNGIRTLIKDTFQKNTSTFDVWQAQFTIRYTFGN